MAYFCFEMDMGNASIHWPDVKEIVETLRCLADSIEANNAPNLRFIDGQGNITASSDVVENCHSVLKYLREQKKQEQAIRAAFVANYKEQTK
jgi:hypothetical protein